jgi:hypothetical protein
VCVHACLPVCVQPVFYILVLAVLFCSLTSGLPPGLNYFYLVIPLKLTVGFSFHYLTLCH